MKQADCAAATAVGDRVARAARSWDKESDPETSIIARTIRFARIDSSSAHALNYSDTSDLPSIQPADRAVSVFGIRPTWTGAK